MNCQIKYSLSQFYVKWLTQRCQDGVFSFRKLILIKCQKKSRFWLRSQIQDFHPSTLDTRLCNWKHLLTHEVYLFFWTCMSSVKPLRVHNRTVAGQIQYRPRTCRCAADLLFSSHSQRRQVVRNYVWFLNLSHDMLMSSGSICLGTVCIPTSLPASTEDKTGKSQGLKLRGWLKPKKKRNETTLKTKMKTSQVEYVLCRCCVAQKKKPEPGWLPLT